MMHCSHCGTVFYDEEVESFGLSSSSVCPGCHETGHLRHGMEYTGYLEDSPLEDPDPLDDEDIPS